MALQVDKDCRHVCHVPCPDAMVLPLTYTKFVCNLAFAVVLLEFFEFVFHSLPLKIGGVWKSILPGACFLCA